MELGLALVVEHQAPCHQVAGHHEAVDAGDVLVLHMHRVGGVRQVRDQADELDVSIVQLLHGGKNLLVVPADDVEAPIITLVILIQIEALEVVLSVAGLHTFEDKSLAIDFKGNVRLFILPTCLCGIGLILHLFQLCEKCRVVFILCWKAICTQLRRLALIAHDHVEQHRGQCPEKEICGMLGLAVIILHLQALLLLEHVEVIRGQQRVRGVVLCLHICPIDDLELLGGAGLWENEAVDAKVPADIRWQLVRALADEVNELARHFMQAAVFPIHPHSAGIVVGDPRSHPFHNSRSRSHSFRAPS